MDLEQDEVGSRGRRGRRKRNGNGLRNNVKETAGVGKEKGV